MGLVFEIGLGLVSAGFCFLLLRLAIRPNVMCSPVKWFDHRDVIFALIIATLLTWMAIGLFEAGEKSFNEEVVLNSLVTQLVCGVAVLGYAIWKKIPLGDFLGFTQMPIWKSLLTGLILMVGVFPFVAFLANLDYAVLREQEAVKFFRGNTSLQARLLLGFMAVIVAPIVEELIFRGLLYRIFSSYLGKTFAMIFTSVLFAAIHGNFAMMLPLTVLALALAASVEASGSLLVSIAMHATFNAINLGMLVVEGAQ